ncbi:MAG: RNase adapter RapZ [Nitrospirae bacterium]|nr:RNase adapter RapZ [Nitrospirota bacterium]
MKGPKSNKLFSVIVTGLSGAGKTVVLHAFEDSDYFCVDNLPMSLIKTFVHLCCKTPDISKIAIGIDIRERKFSADLAETISSLRRSHSIEILFLEAKDDTLIRRYKETRRPHPLGYKDLKKAISKERKMLAGIREASDRIIDTSSLSPHELKKLITQIYSSEKETPMSVSLISFGYKYGAPPEADLLFDVRFLPNPYFIKELKKFNGTNLKIKNFLFGKKETQNFFAKLYPLMDFLIPRYKEEGRNYLTIGIGCTGGKHRSPAIVEAIHKHLQKQKFNVRAIHRDMDSAV